MLQIGEVDTVAPYSLDDPVDEEDVRNDELVERTKCRSGRRSAGWVGVDDDDRDIGDREGLCAIGRESDRAGHVDDREIVAEILEIVEVELGRAAALSRLRARIADAGAAGRRS